MRATPLVVFSGIDGAGKSTQIQLLAEHLADHQRRVVVLWTRIGYTQGMNAARNLARLLLGPRIMPPPGHNPARERALGRPIVRRWWLRLAMLDLIVCWGIWLRILRWRGYSVICDRYWYDSELDLRLNFPDEHASSWWLWKLVVWSCPKPDAAFLLFLPWDEYQERSLRKQEPYPLSHVDFEQRARFYLACNEDGSWILLDGLRPKHELANAVLANLEQLACPATG